MALSLAEFLGPAIGKNYSNNHGYRAGFLMHCGHEDFHPQLLGVGPTLHTFDTTTQCQAGLQCVNGLCHLEMHKVPGEVNRLACADNRYSTNHMELNLCDLTDEVNDSAAMRQAGQRICGSMGATVLDYSCHPPINGWAD